MTKAELESQRWQYYSLLDKAHAAEQAGEYRGAIEHATASLPFVDGMMQFERKFENRDFRSIGTIDVVLKYAPLLLHFPSLDELATLLKSQKRIDKNASDDLAARVAQSRHRMWDAHKLWSHLEQHANSRQDELRRSLGGDQDEWRSLAEAWEKMKVLRRTPEAGSYCLNLVTQMSELTSGKCPACGRIGRAPKFKLVASAVCPKCRTRVSFVLLPEKLNAASQE